MLVEALLDDRSHFPRDRRVDGSKRLGPLLVDNACRLWQWQTTHQMRRLTREHFVEHRAERVDVRAGVYISGLARHLLWAHVLQRADHTSHFG